VGRHTNRGAAITPPIIKRVQKEYCPRMLFMLTNTTREKQYLFTASFAAYN
jgi:hypothetical protein